MNPHFLVPSVKWTMINFKRKTYKNKVTYLSKTFNFIKKFVFTFKILISILYDIHSRYNELGKDNMFFGWTDMNLDLFIMWVSFEILLLLVSMHSCNQIAYTLRRMYNLFNANIR